MFIHFLCVVKFASGEFNTFAPLIGFDLAGSYYFVGIFWCNGLMISAVGNRDRNGIGYRSSISSNLRFTIRLSSTSPSVAIIVVNESVSPHRTPDLHKFIFD